MKTKTYLLAAGITLAAFGTGFGQSTLQFSTNNYYVAENAGNVILTVQRTGDTNVAATVDYASADGTATNGLDYTTTSGTLTFAAGETNQTITVPILNDGLVEPAYETFTVTLSNPNNAVLGTRTVGTVRITDNDKGFTFEFANYSVRESEGSVLIGVVQNSDGNLPTSVDFAASNLTATNGLDYAATNGTLFFAIGENVKLFTVPILNDGLKEASETFRLTLGNPTNQVLGSPFSAVVTILDTDPGVQLERNQYRTRESDGQVAVRVLRGNDVDLSPITVEYATSNLTAVAGEDYVATQGTLVFAEGETARLLSVPILVNPISQVDRQFKLTLSNPSAGVVLGTNPTATITVLDMTGTEPHRFGGVSLRSDGSAELTLAGGVHTRFKPYFDLYPIEASSNLVDWFPWVTLQRTNSATSALVYADTAVTAQGQRFFRTATNQLTTPVSKPTGPFPVGVVSRMLTDPTRRNRYHVSTNGSFMISLWYPAVPAAGKLPAQLEDQQLAEDPGWPAAWGMAAQPDREPYFVSHALPDMECASTGAPYPVVIYSHGAYDGRTTIMERGPELASYGYVVVGVNHYDAFGTVFPDGTYLHGEDANTFSATTAGFQDRVKDLRFVLDQLELWNGNDPVFAGRLNLTNVATMGYSWGCGVAGEVARVDPRCRAAISLEGYFVTTDELQLAALGVSKPLLSICATPLTYPGSELQLYNKATHDAIWFQVTSTTHLTFVDYYWFASSGQIPGLREAMRTMNAYTLWFLNRYLKDSPGSMPALANYPRVINFKQK